MEHSVEEQVEEAFLDTLETRLGYKLPTLLDEYEMEINELLMETLANCLLDLEDLEVLSNQQLQHLQKEVGQHLVPKSAIYHHEWKELCHES